MIHKIDHIVSVGKFRNFQAAGDIAFRKFTLIYADNGIGKTTLTAILRSLGENNPEIVVKRLTTNHTTPQGIQIIQRDIANVDTTHTYRPTGWSNPFSNLEIFDVHFVANNVYSGIQFSTEHGYNLHQFIIGAAGVAIGRQIEQNKADKAAARIEIERLRNVLFAQVGFGLNENEIGTFLTLTPNDAIGINALIAAAQIQLNNAQASQAIQTFQSLTSIPQITGSFNIPEIITDLQTTVQQIQDTVLQQLFQTHCDDLRVTGVPQPEKWLRIGFDYIRTKNQSSPPTLACPFCQQTVGTRLDIIRSYSQTFNDAFNALIARLEAHRSALQGFSVLAAMQPLLHINNQNTTHVATWRQYLPAAQAPVLTLPAQADFQALINNLISAVSQKISNPSVAIAIDPANQLTIAIQAINTGVVTYNQAVQDYNGAITAFRATIPTVPVAQAEFNRLNRIEQRFVPAVDANCVLLTTVSATLVTLTNAYPGLVAAQDTAASTFFSSYGTSVNRYLGAVFQTPFQITDIQNVRPVGRATQSRFGYSITINGQPVPFDSAQAYNASDCLSEGDKSTLAFSFFMAKLDNDPNKADKIVVFDDPLSSFDGNRRFKTINELMRLAAQVKQLVVLSHDGKFLFDIHRRISGAERKGLTLTYNSTNDTTIIEALNIDKVLQNAYFTSLDAIRDFIATGTDPGKESARREIRLVLESYIAFKFYNQLNGNVHGMFGQLIDRLEQAASAGLTFRDPNAQQIIADLRELNNISWDVHHGSADPLATMTPIPIENISLAELKTYLQSTLDLIDRRL